MPDPQFSQKSDQAANSSGQVSPFQAQGQTPGTKKTSATTTTNPGKAPNPSPPGAATATYYQYSSTVPETGTGNASAFDDSLKNDGGTNSGTTGTWSENSDTSANPAGPNSGYSQTSPGGSFSSSGTQSGTQGNNYSNSLKSNNSGTQSTGQKLTGGAQMSSGAGPTLTGPTGPGKNPAANSVSFSQKKMTGNGIIQNGQTVYVTSAVKFALKSSDNMSGVKKVEFRVDDQNFQDYKQPISFPTEGQYILNYRAMDAANNIEQEKSLKVIVDNTPPWVTHEIDGTHWQTPAGLVLKPGAKIKLVAGDNSVGLGAIYYQLSGSKMAYQEPVSPSTGSQKMIYTARDKLGNQTKSFPLNFIVDGFAPTVKMSLPPGIVLKQGTYIFKSKDLLTLQAQDAHSGVASLEFRLGDQVWKLESEQGKLSGQDLKDKGAGSQKQNLEIRARDRAGNLSQKIIFPFLLDDKPPESEINIQ